MMKIGKSIAAFTLGTCVASTSFAADADYKWSNVSMGGGGFVSAVLASKIEKNVFYARTDVGGAYRWNESTAHWESMMDWVDFSELGLLGVEAMGVDPKTEGVVYLMTGTSYFSNGRSAFLRSSDYGKNWEILYTWDETGEKGDVVKFFGVHGNGMGRGNGEALAIDENDPDNLFYGSRRSGLWKSTNNGASWSHVDAWTKAAGSDTTWNGSGFSFVQYAPGSSKVLYAGFLRDGSKSNGTFENVFTSTDGGTTWKALPIPDSLRSTSGGSLVRLMPQRAVVSSDGKKLTVTFADGAGPHSMMWDEDWGMIYDGFGRGAVLQYDVSAGIWSDISPEDFIDEGGDAKYDNVDVQAMAECESAGGSDCESSYPYIAPYGGIAINPNNSDEMVVTTEGYRGPQFWYTATSDTSGTWSDQWGTNIYHTTDGGKTWVASFKYYWMEGGYYPTTQQMDANGVGWMHNGSIHWSGSVAIDPFNHDRVFVSSGNGIFRTENLTDYTVIPAGTYDTTTNYYYSSDEAVQGQVWKFSAHGIEETVPYEVASIPNGPLISVTADYDGFRHDDIAKYPSHRHLTSVSGKYVSLGSTWGLAYAPVSGTLVKVTDARAYKDTYNTIPIDPVQFSTDSGKTWTVETYVSLDETLKGGTVAISADGAVTLWVPGNSDAAVYRKANSAWNKVSGIDNNSFVVGDAKNANVFYAYNRTTGVFYKSTDKGASFVKVSEPGTSNDKKFRSIPGYEGDLWLPVAVRDDNGNPKNGSLKHSTDGGATWTDANGMGYCEAVGYGISKTGKGYPAIYAFGKVDDVLGVFVSDDQGATWTRVNDDAHEYGGLANGEFVMGDMNTYGVVYMSTAGRGIAVRVPSDWDMGTSESTAAVKSVPQQEPTVQFSKLATLEGSNLNLTVNNARVNVALFDLKGNRVFSKSYTSSTVLSLNEMVNARGAYIVRVMSGSTLMLTAKVNLR